MADLIIEAPKRILDAPRTLLLETFCAWLSQQEEFSTLLPNTEIVVSVLSKPFLPPRYAGARDAIGCFAATVSNRLNAIWEIALSYGETCDDDCDWTMESWCITLPHELLHLASFAAAHQSRTPFEAGWPAVINQAADEDAIESHARAITARFARTHAALLGNPDLLPSADGLSALGL